MSRLLKDDSFIDPGEFSFDNLQNMQDLNDQDNAEEILDQK